MTSSEVVFLIDVDNTLLDNDHLIADLRAHLEQALDVAARERYFAILEELRTELGYVDYLQAFQRLRIEAPADDRRVCVAQFLLEYPFAHRLYPQALAVAAHLRSLGRSAILSDGDAVFQPRKIERSGLRDAFGGEVLLYVHKERMLDVVLQRYPASHYVMIDDKATILEEMKAAWGSRLTTVFVRQGHYALDARTVASVPAADLTLERIGDLLGHGASTFLAQD